MVAHPMFWEFLERACCCNAFPLGAALDDKARTQLLSRISFYVLQLFHCLVAIPSPLPIAELNASNNPTMASDSPHYFP